jgi:hypothetical protein
VPNAHQRSFQSCPFFRAGEYRSCSSLSAKEIHSMSTGDPSSTVRTPHRDRCLSSLHWSGRSNDGQRAALLPQCRHGWTTCTLTIYCRNRALLHLAQVYIVGCVRTCCQYDTPESCALDARTVEFGFPKVRLCPSWQQRGLIASENIDRWSQATRAAHARLRARSHCRSRALTLSPASPCQEH